MMELEIAVILFVVGNSSFGSGVACACLLEFLLAARCACDIGQSAAPHRPITQRILNQFMLMMMVWSFCFSSTCNVYL